MTSTNQHRCRVHRILPEILYSTWYYISVPSLNFETPKISFKVKVKDENHFRNGTTEHDFFRIAHVTFSDLFPRHVTLLGSINAPGKTYWSFNALHPQDDKHHKSNPLAFNSPPKFYPKILSPEFQKVNLRFKGQPFLVSSSNWNSKMRSKEEMNKLQNFKAGNLEGMKVYLSGTLDRIKNQLTSSYVTNQKCFENDVIKYMEPLISEYEYELLNRRNAAFINNNNNSNDGDDNDNNEFKRYHENYGFRVDTTFSVKKLEETDDDDDDDDDDGDDDDNNDNGETTHYFKYLLRHNNSNPHLKISVPEGQSVLKWWFTRRGVGHLKDSLYDVTLMSGRSDGGASISVAGEHKEQVTCPMFLEIVIIDVSAGVKVSEYDVIIPCPPPKRINLAVNISKSVQLNRTTLNTSEDYAHFIRAIARFSHLHDVSTPGVGDSGKSAAKNNGSTYLVVISDASSEPRHFYLSSFIYRPNELMRDSRDVTLRPQVTTRPPSDASCHLKYLLVAFTSMLAMLLGVACPRHHWPGSQAGHFIGCQQALRTQETRRGCCQTEGTRKWKIERMDTSLFCCLSLIVAVTCTCLCSVEVERWKDSLPFECTSDGYLEEHPEIYQSILETSRCCQHFNVTLKRISKLIRERFRLEIQSNIFPSPSFKRTSKMIKEILDMIDTFTAIYDQLIDNRGKQCSAKFQRNSWFWTPWFVNSKQRNALSSQILQSFAGRTSRPPRVSMSLDMNGHLRVENHATPATSTTARNDSCHFKVPQMSSITTDSSRFVYVSQRLKVPSSGSEVNHNDAHCLGPQGYQGNDKKFNFFYLSVAWVSEKMNFLRIKSCWSLYILIVVLLDILFCTCQCLLDSNCGGKFLGKHGDHYESLKEKMSRLNEGVAFHPRKFLSFVRHPLHAEMESSDNFTSCISLLESKMASTSRKCDLLRENRTAPIDIHRRHSSYADVSKESISLPAEKRQKAKKCLLPLTPEKRSGTQSSDRKTRGDCDIESHPRISHIFENFPCAPRSSSYIRASRCSTVGAMLTFHASDSKQFFRAAMLGTVFVTGQLIASIHHVTEHLLSLEIHKDSYGEVDFTTTADEELHVMRGNLISDWSNGDLRHLQGLLTALQLGRKQDIDFDILIASCPHTILPSLSVAKETRGHHGNDKSRRHRGDSDRARIKNIKGTPRADVHWSVKEIFPSTLRHWTEDVVNVNVHLAPLILLISDFVLVLKIRHNNQNRWSKKTFIDPVDELNVSRNFWKSKEKTSRIENCRNYAPEENNSRKRFPRDEGAGAPPIDPILKSDEHENVLIEEKSASLEKEKFPRSRMTEPDLSHKVKRFPNDWVLYEETNV